MHEEKHEKNFAKHGGVVEMVQLWLNLPKAYKMLMPAYQTLLDAQIPAIPLASDQSFVRIIAGDFNSSQGPAKTFTPVNLYDVRLSAASVQRLSSR